MRKEIKTAIIGAIIIVIAIGGLAVFFTSLDKTVASTGNQITVDKTNTGNSSSVQTTYADESNYPKAPDLVGISGYINTTPEQLQAKIKDKVVLYDFWTYSCINCIRTFPYLKAWNDKYADKGLLIIGVHSPEFEFEKDINNVKMAAQKYGLTYPIVLDSDHMTWDAFSNRYWPAEYITDDLGHIRHTHFGEGEYDQTEKVIQQLLDQRAKRLGLNTIADQSLVNLQAHEFSLFETPELYFGYDFADGRNYFGNSEGFQPDKIVSYTIPADLQKDHFYLDGQWQNLHDSMKLSSDNGKIVLPYTAQDVHIVASGVGTGIQVLLDGKPVTSDDAGQDIKNGTAIISEHRLYNIISSKQAGSHTVTIIGHPGFEIYTFTFG
ncbi:redoxin family protein [Candidatus Nitrosotalea sp. FS]|uniref:redoxin family protein n=1 Tax=Candidatus Nitrosotalea sp. FS TaxID=2341021 RepID=UPI00140C36DE|nr:redoxin family protein [Candidatus Nitrosotalea sp. FS]